jgi:hypothetical protein
MQVSAHNIGSIRLQVKGATAAQAWPLRQQLDAMLQDICDSELDTMLGDLDLPGRQIIIPSLHIDLGKVPDTDIRDRVLHLLREALLVYKADIHENAHGRSVVVADAFLPGAEVITTMQRQEQLLLHYMQYGYFPWGISEIAKTALLQTFTADPADFLAHWPKEAVRLQPVWERVLAHAGPGSFSYIWNLYLEKLALAGAGDAVLPWYSNFPELLKEQTRNQHLILSQSLQHVASTVEQVAADPGNAAAIAAQRLVILYRQADLVPPVLTINRQGEQQLSVIQSMAKEILPADAVADVAEPVIVPFLGMVLLHPFIAMFLGSLGLMDERQRFRGATDRMMALGALLQLCNGHTDVPEYHMLFLKIVLGIPHSKALQRHLWESRAAGFEAESIALLDSVIGHWNALRRTSVQGLRESFLQRRGRLYTDDDKIILKIERNGFDVLLDRLPWSYSEIHLPWLRRQIYTEW